MIDGFHHTEKPILDLSQGILIKKKKKKLKIKSLPQNVI